MTARSLFHVWFIVMLGRGFSYLIPVPGLLFCFSTDLSFSCSVPGFFMFEHRFIIAMFRGGFSYLVLVPILLSCLNTVLNTDLSYIFLFLCGAVSRHILHGVNTHFCAHVVSVGYESCFLSSLKRCIRCMLSSLFPRILIDCCRTHYPLSSCDLKRQTCLQPRLTIL